MSDIVKLERREKVAIVTLDNTATRNAMSRDLLLALRDRLAELRHDPDCRAIVLTGAGGHFCSGGDLSGMKLERTLPMARMRMELAHQVVRGIVESTKPVVAAVDGFAAGAGLSLAACCDFVVAASDARFMASFGKVGLLPDMALFWTLPQRIGLAESKRMIASVRIVPAAEAYELGLVDHVVEPGSTLNAACAVAADCTVASPNTVSLMKSAFASLGRLDDALRWEMDNQSAMFLTRDHREGVNAFFDKRPPDFKGE